MWVQIDTQRTKQEKKEKKRKQKEKGTLGLLLIALLEMLVIAAETALYHRYLPRVTGEEQPHGKALGYAMMANILSFVLGVFLMRRMPWMF